MPAARPSVPCSVLPATIHSLSLRAAFLYLNTFCGSGGTFIFLKGNTYRCTTLPVLASRRSWRWSSEWRPSSQRYKLSKVRRRCASSDSTAQPLTLRVCALCTSQMAHAVALTS